MTTEERKSFDDFKRELLENPIIGLNFFGNMDKVELDNIGDLTTRNRLMNEAKNKFICQHLGVNYGKRILKYQTKIWPRNGLKDCRIKFKYQNRVGLHTDSLPG